FFFFFSSRRRHTRFSRDWSSDVCSSDLVNPGYSKEAGKQAPIFASRGRTVTDANTQTSRIPSLWMLGFYNGSILDDDARGSVIYYNYPATPANQLGDESSTVPDRKSVV